MKYCARGGAQVNQAKLTYMDPAQKEAQAGVRGALGKAYEQQLRAEADAVAPDKLSKRKHQINSLYHAAKLKVRAQGLRLRDLTAVLRVRSAVEMGIGQSWRALEPLAFIQN